MPLIRCLSLFLFLMLVVYQPFVRAQSVLIDEDFSDWEAVSSLSDESGGDAGSGEIDILDVKVSSDSDYLYFYLRADQEFLLQDNDGIALLIDTDNDPDTGEFYQGLGYELIFNFGEREGVFYGAGPQGISSYDIGLVSAPTVTSDTFEFKIDRDIALNGSPLFPTDTIRILFRTRASNGDLAPDHFDDTFFELSEEAYAPEPITLDKFHPEDIRVLSYNVLTDNLFNTEVSGQFERIFQAIQPDIIGLQEVYEHSGEDAAQLMEYFLPGGEGESWYHGDVGNDNLIVSLYPVVRQQAIMGNAAYLLDAGETELLVVVAHPPCCNNDDGRQEEFDAIMSFIRDSKSGQAFDIAEDTPILVIGDMNLVGDRRQVETLLTGDIVDEGQFGPDFKPDWDESNLEDAIPLNPGLPTTFTWYREVSSFGAGRLDYIVYSGSVWELQNSYSLFTPALPEEVLTAYGLQGDDSIIASDHLPLVADFRPVTATSVPESSEIPEEIQLQQNYPNPFNPSTTIQYQLAEQSMVTLEIFDLHGKRMKTLVHQQQSPGAYTTRWDARNQASGLYLLRLKAGNEILNRKMLLVK